MYNTTAKLRAEVKNNEFDFLRNHLELTSKYIQIFLEKDFPQINEASILELIYCIQTVKDALLKFEVKLIKKD